MTKSRSGFIHYLKAEGLSLRNRRGGREILSSHPVGRVRKKSEGPRWGGGVFEDGSSKLG